MSRRSEATSGGNSKLAAFGSWVKPLNATVGQSEHMGTSDSGGSDVRKGGYACWGAPFNDRFVKLVRGHWLDSIGNSIIVSKCADEEDLTAVLSPLIDHPDARDRVFMMRLEESKTWRCGTASLEWADESQQRLVWVTQDGRRSVWSRSPERSDADALATTDGGDGESKTAAFPWLINHATPEPWLPHDVPRDILYDGARVAALLDIRQLLGAKSERQEVLTHILMDHDLQPMRGDYLIPGVESTLWQKLPVPEATRRIIFQRISRIPHEALSQRVSWSGATEIWVGHHKISCRSRDIQTLESRWVLQPKDPQKSLEIARLLALYSVFDNPLSNRRNGVHLGLDPDLRRKCDYELFASPLNAAVGNGRFASKWPHVEWRFGSIGSYPSVLSILPLDSVVCVNPPFTDAYLEDVMARIAELKHRFRLRIAVPIHDASWRKKLQSSLPSAQLLRTYYDATAEHSTEVLHPTLLWEDPRCPKENENGSGSNGADSSAAAGEEDKQPDGGGQGTPATAPAEAILVGVAAATPTVNGPAVAFFELPLAASVDEAAAAVAAAMAGQAVAAAVEADEELKTQKEDQGDARINGGLSSSSGRSRRQRSAAAAGYGSAGNASGSSEAAEEREKEDSETQKLDASEWPALSLGAAPKRGGNGAKSKR